MAARAYRELLKVQRNLFAGDHQARIAARVETRSQFVSRANAEPSEVPALIEEAYNTAGFLHENVAQTVLNDKGNYELKPQPQHLSYEKTPPPLPCSADVNR